MLPLHWGNLSEASVPVETRDLRGAGVARCTDGGRRPGGGGGHGGGEHGVWAEEVLLLTDLAASWHWSLIVSWVICITSVTGFIGGVLGGSETSEFKIHKRFSDKIG